MSRLSTTLLKGAMAGPCLQKKEEVKRSPQAVTVRGIKMSEKKIGGTEIREEEKLN